MVAEKEKNSLNASITKFVKGKVISKSKNDKPWKN